MLLLLQVLMLRYAAAEETEETEALEAEQVAGIKTAMMDEQGVMLAVLVELVLTAVTALMV